MCALCVCNEFRQEVEKNQKYRQKQKHLFFFKAKKEREKLIFYVCILYRNRV